MNTPRVTVIDYGVGNLLSVQRGLEHCGAEVTLTSDAEQILSASRIVLPGVGAFQNGMQALEQFGLIEVIQEVANRKIPLLGICLGMQLLLTESEEFGLTKGLALIPGRVIPVPTLALNGETQKIPHIGWSSLQYSNIEKKWDGSVLHDNQPGSAAYFVHSFMAIPDLGEHRVADCIYGGHRVPAVLACNQISGCQFHPEKSGEVGIKVLRRFISL
jgi:imidazole glycerol-phosphate synthase subunit HisH